VVCGRTYLECSATATDLEWYAATTDLEWYATGTKRGRGRGGSDTGGGSPGTTTSGRAQGRQGKREKGESGGGWPVGRPAEWVPPVSEGRREGREWQVGPVAIQIKFKIIQIRSNLVRIKTSLTELKNFEIKYGCEVFDKRNNFTNFLRFRMDFELKFWEVKV
jgi:hypothetical protein